MIHKLIKVFLPLAAFLYIALLVAQVIAFSQSPIDADSITDLKVRVAVLEAAKKSADDSRALMYSLIGGSVLNLVVSVSSALIVLRYGSKKRAPRSCDRRRGDHPSPKTARGSTPAPLATSSDS
jgi:hypothetical protein